MRRLVLFLSLCVLPVILYGQNVDFFVGDTLAAGVIMKVDWAGSVEIAHDKGYPSVGSSVKLTTGSGWDGVDFLLPHIVNMSTWSLDTLEFEIYFEAGMGDLTIWLLDPDEDGPAKGDYAFPATYFVMEDSLTPDEWNVVRLPLKDFNRNNGRWDDSLSQQVPGTMDTTKLDQFWITGMGQPGWTDGIVIYFDDLRIKTGTVTGIENKTQGVSSYRLSQNYPNPFNPSTTIQYDVNRAGRVRIQLFNALGQKIKTLCDEFKPAGSYTLSFSGEQLPSGVYYYRMQTDNFIQTKKMLLVK